MRNARRNRTSLVLLLLVMSLGCETEGRSPAASSAKPTDAVVPELPAEGRQALIEPGRKIQYRVSEFPEVNANRLVELVLSIKGPRQRDDKLDDRLFEILASRVPAPYELRRRDQIERGEMPWARMHVTLRRRLDRFRKHGKKQPRRGKMTFDVQIADRLPDGFVSNWTGFHYDIVYERPYEQLVAMDEEIWRSFAARLPSLVIQSSEAARDFPLRMELREELAAGELHVAIDKPLVDIYGGGCAAFSTLEGLALYRLQRLEAPPLMIGDKRHVAVRCNAKGAFVAIPETDRSARVRYLPWSGEKGWDAQASFARGVDIALLRFVAAGDSLCLIGERGNVGERHAKIQCFSAETGAPKWEWTEPGTDLEGITIRKGVLAFAAGRHLRLMNVDDGSPLWHGEVAQATGLSGDISSTCLVNNTFIFPNDIGRYLAFDLEAKTSPWELTTYGGRFLYCDEAEGMYLDEAGGMLLALNVSTMTPKWRMRANDEILDALSHGGVLFVLIPGAIYALDAGTGGIVWQVGLPVQGDKLFRFDRRLYVIDGETLYELTKASRL